VDADPQASLTVSLGYRVPDELPVTLSTVLQRTMAEDAPSGDYGVLHHEEGIDLLPANIELSAFEIGLVNVISRELVLRDTLAPLRQQYDTILIDCMPSMGLLTINALAAADSVIIPTQASYLSTKGLGLLMRTVSRIQRQINPKLRIDGVLLTMVDKRTNHAKDISRSLREMGSQLHVFDTEIPFSVRAAEAAAAGKSVFASDPAGRVADAYSRLAKEVTELEQTQDRPRSEECVR